MKVIHESSKLYWKRKCTLDLLVVEHATFDVYELRSYEPVINVEGQPLYIDKSVLISMLNEDDVVTLIRTLKEPFLRRKEVPDEATIAQKARNDALAELILNRIHIEEYSVQNKVLVVAVINTLMDMERGRAQLCCAKPPGLTNYTWVHSNQHT